MDLLRPFAVNDATLISSSISDSAVEELAGDQSGELETAGDVVGTIELAGDVAGENEWQADVLYLPGDKVKVTATDYHHEFEALGLDTRAVVAMTIAAPCVVTWTAHGLPAGTPITFTTTGALPTGLSVGVIYYVVAPATNTFNVAATIGGGAIATTGSQSGVHTAIANPNLDIDPTSDAGLAYWLDLGATNRWRMFDQLNGSLSAAPNEIEVTVEFGGISRVDAIALINVNAASVHITSEVDGDSVFDQTISLVSTLGITNWYAYFFEEIVRRSKLITYLPPYAGQTITVDLLDEGGTVSIGSLIFGRIKNLGLTTYGANVGIDDFSRKDTDDFGNYTVVPRAFRDTSDVKVWCDTNRVDDIKETLANYRATPTVWIGNALFDSLLIFGFYQSFGLEITGPNKSYCNLTLEGLT